MLLILKKNIIRHAIAWFLITVCLSLADPIHGGWKVFIIGTVLFIGNYIFTYYSLNLFIFSRFLNRYILLFAWVAFVFIIYEIVMIFTANIALPYLGGKNVRYPISTIIINSLLIYFFIFISALGNFINRLGTQKTKIQNEREKALIIKELEVLKKEKAVMEKELDFLKNQFNAHITFNFLNFCYSKVYKTSEKAATAIETFADMLRYSLQIKPDENVPLKKEIEYIENFIRIQRCLTTKVCVNFQYQGCIEAKLILPRILITFVENAFKHGQINNELYPIEIHLLANPENIIFKVQNKKTINKKIISSNIGRQNVKQMLNSFYNEKYHLSIKNMESDYTIELTLTI
jgi:sensor histidine kinase YesM